MKKFLLISAIALQGSFLAHAQFSEFRNNENDPDNINIQSGKTSLEFGGRVSAFYEQRWLKAGNNNYKHNGFAMKDVDVDMIGTASGFVFEIHLSPLDMVHSSSIGNSNNIAGQNGTNASPDPYSPGIKAAYVAYEGKKLPIHVKLGYDKLPYSQGSMNDAYSSAMWSHANLFGGDFYSRRDLGLTLYKSFWKKRITVYAGVYSGLGETVFEYGNDASGKPEYVGRITFSYPAKVKYNSIDEKNSPVPVFRVGLNARYTDKTQPTGRLLTQDVPDAIGPYGTRTIDGKKTVYGGDFIFLYKGFSALFETDIIRAKPANAGDPLFESTPASFNGGYVKAGGFCAGLNYNWSKAKSVFSVDYEQLNGNDLVDGTQEWLHIGYAYTVKHFNSVLKIEYYKPLKEDVIQNSLKYTELLRIGYQIVF